MEIDQNILRFLKKYSYNVRDINRLLVTSFLNVNRIYGIKNELITQYIISEDEEELNQLNKFITLINKKKFDIEKLIKLFEFVISPADKEVNGAVYTPKHIREFIVHETLNKYIKTHNSLTNIKIGDVACGCGGFFITIVEELKKYLQKSYYEIYRDNLYGLDIQSYSIERSKILLILYAVSNGESCESYKFNLYQGNALNFDWRAIPNIKENGGFDIIVGNPPYVGSSKIDNVSKELLKNWSVSNSGKADLYIPFFQIGLEYLTSSGFLGYISVNTFYKSLNGRSLRAFFSKNNFDLSIVDFGGQQLFKNRSTYTCICIIGIKSSENIKYVQSNINRIKYLKESDYITIPFLQLNHYDGWYLVTDKERKIIDRIEKTGKPLGEKFEIRNGFATLKNDIYLINPFKENEKYYFINKNESEFKIEKHICRNAIKPNTLKSEKEISSSTEKIIFPYFIKNGVSDLFRNHKYSAELIDEATLITDYPYTYNYLNTQKKLLSKRDKGQGNYGEWYAFGRSQGLLYNKYKLLFPYISNEPCFVISEDRDLLFYNGYAILSDSIEDLRVLQKILMSKIFWYYIIKTSKPYSSGYYSLAKNYIKKFGICDLSKEEKETFLSLIDENDINEFLFMKYEISME